MERLFGVDGLLRRIVSTVVLVTHEVECLLYADQVLVISDGNLRREDAPERSIHQALLPDAVANEGLEESTELTMKDKAAEISKANDINDLRRATGDSAVDRYYLRYIGWTNAMIFVFFVTVNVFSSTYSQIWLERWANRGGGQKPLYVTIYFLLAICNIIGNGGCIWAILILISPATARRLQYVVLKTVISQDMTLIESQLPIGVLITVSIEGLATIQAFGWESDFQSKNSRLLDVTQRTYYMLNCIQRWLSRVLDLIVAAEAILVVSLAVSLRQSTSVGLLGVSLNSILSFNGSLSPLTLGWIQLEISLGSILRVRNFEMDVISEVTSGKIEPPSDWPDQGAINVSNVTAQYHPKAIALKNISSLLLLVRRSVFVGALGGVLSITNGSILIDNVDLATIPPETVRERLVTIPQDPFIMVGCTFGLNTDPTGKSSDADIVAALDRVGI
ncbi:uncharacterized protein N7503_005243 [Penicillium pulvis]|uniref:uncharacterized protein n=1 Tax=Penicillium pulvis TaxID=1562058 RepID=UPI002546EF79|nr:uncharacterized protein N7503_005243 [Penicillium pulvis]KAJ5802793.1 hypothetical protein N7503_005243 [Penicillium pulvis]